MVIICSSTLNEINQHPETELLKNLIIIVGPSTLYKCLNVEDEFPTIQPVRTAGLTSTSEKDEVELLRGGCDGTEKDEQSRVGRPLRGLVDLAEERALEIL